MTTFVFPDKLELNFTGEHGDCFVRNMVAVRLTDWRTDKHAYSEIKRRTFNKLAEKPEEVSSRYLHILLNKLKPTLG